MQVVSCKSPMLHMHCAHRAGLRTTACSDSHDTKAAFGGEMYEQWSPHMHDTSLSHSNSLRRAFVHAARRIPSMRMHSCRDFKAVLFSKIRHKFLTILCVCGVELCDVCGISPGRRCRRQLHSKATTELADAGRGAERSRALASIHIASSDSVLALRCGSSLPGAGASAVDTISRLVCTTTARD